MRNCVTPECNERNEASVTVPSRLNPPIVLWRLNDLTLPARVGLKLSTWPVGVRCGSALDSPSHGRVLSTFEMGILAMWMMENVRHLSGHLFLEELSSCRKCYGIYREREPVKRGLPTFSSLFSTVTWVKNCRSKKGIKQCLGGLKCSQNTKKNKETLTVSFKRYSMYVLLI